MSEHAFLTVFVPFVPFFFWFRSHPRQQHRLQPLSLLTRLHTPPPFWLPLFTRPYGLPVAYRQLFERFERIVSRHDGRPHWAKAHALVPADFKRMYPKFDDFVAVLRRHDPEGMFVNPYIRRHVFGETGADVAPRVYKERA